MCRHSTLQPPSKIINTATTAILIMAVGGFNIALKKILGASVTIMYPQKAGFRRQFGKQNY